MKKHPIKEKLEAWASSEIWRIVPETFTFTVPTKHAETALSCLRHFVWELQKQFDVYERIAFQIEEHDEDVEEVKIRGRYGFSEVTKDARSSRGNLYKIDQAFTEKAFGGPCEDLNGRYTAMELIAIANKLNDQYCDSFGQLKGEYK